MAIANLIPNNLKTVVLTAFALMERGRKKVEEELQRMMPDARIIRMDADTTRRKEQRTKIQTATKS